MNGHGRPLHCRPQVRCCRQRSARGRGRGRRGEGRRGAKRKRKRKKWLRNNTKDGVISAQLQLLTSASPIINASLPHHGIQTTHGSNNNSSRIMEIGLELPRQKITVVSATFPRLLLHSQLRLQVYAGRATRCHRKGHQAGSLPRWNNSLTILSFIYTIKLQSCFILISLSLSPYLLGSVLYDV